MTRCCLLALVIAGFLCAAGLRQANADTLDLIRQRGKLVWGGDQEGGGPYIYPRPDDPSRVTGFEVELMQLLSGWIVTPEFKQCDWKNLPDNLRIGDIDVVVNGYELTPDHLRTKIATIPYYIYQFQLIARTDDDTIRSWDDLKSAREPRKIGVLVGSAAETYIRQQLGANVEIVSFDGTTDALQKVVDGQIDATVQDLPAAVFYRDRFPKLHFVGAPVGRGYYVMYLRPGDERLRDQLNSGLRYLIDSGNLRKLYEKYHIWNPTQEQLSQSNSGQEIAAVSIDQTGWKVVERNLPILLQSAAMTVFLSCVSMPLAIMVGLMVAIGRLYGPGPLRWVLTIYVEVLRGTPLLLQLITIFFVLPAFGINISALPAAILGLAVNYSAYEAEIYRAGLLAIPAGQMEAALALGMPRVVALRRVIVPQAVKLVVPPVTNDFIALFKDTSICSVITVVELTKRFSILSQSTGAYLELLAVTAILYLLMSYPLSLLARRLERRVPHIVH